MQKLFIQFLILSSLMAAYTTFVFQAGVDSCKADVNDASEKKFTKDLAAKQTELDTAIKEKLAWEKEASDLKKIKAPKVENEKNDITKNNSGCDSIDGFSVFWSKLQERQSIKSTE